MFNSFKIKKTIIIFLHVSAWGLLLLFFLFLDDGLNNETSLFVNLLTLSFYFLPYLGLFYFNSLFNIKRYLVTKKFIKFLLWLIVSIFIVVSIESYIDYLEYLGCCKGREAFIWKYRVLDNFFFSFFVLGLSFSYSFLKIWRKNEKLKKVAELKLLKSQMNPHFLFNSLNTLYALLSEKEVEKAEDAILKLSDILRYSVYQVNNPKVTLADEITYIKNYIALQELRLAGKVTVTFKCTAEKNNLFIEPMLLIPFVENAFKHGVSYTNDSSIHIKLNVKEKELNFYVRNTINEIPKKTNEYSGVGINNVVSRLKLLYPNNHKLQVERINGFYSVFLTIRS